MHLTNSTLVYTRVRISRLESTCFLAGPSDKGRHERALFSLRVVSHARYPHSGKTLFIVLTILRILLLFS